MALTIGIPSSIEKQGFFLNNYCTHKVKKGKKLKIMLQNNAIFCRVALLGP
jgi:hypothetical protein